MINRALANEQCQLPDEYGDTASSTNGSDPEAPITCDDDLLPNVQPVHLDSLIGGDKEHTKVTSSQLLEKPALDSTKAATFAGNSFFHRTKPFLTRAKSDGTSPLSEVTSSEKSNEHLKIVSQLQQHRHQEESSSREITSMSSHEMRNELVRIESKIKAAISHNTQVHSNSIELESVLRKSLASVPLEIGATTPSSVQLDSLGNPDLDFEGDLPTVSLDDMASQSYVDLQHENLLLKQKLSQLKAELSRTNEANMKAERAHAATITKLKKELRSSNKLVHKLQSKKLSDMESNFATSMDLLEAKLSEEINNGDEMEQKLAAMKEERDRARELNLPLFNDIKRLYEIKAGLEQTVREQMEANAALEQKVKDLIASEKLVVEKARAVAEEAATDTQDLNSPF